MRDMMAEAIFAGRGLTKRFGAIEACMDVDVDFHPGQLTAIVGDNGAGKSTLLKMLTGVLQPDTGTMTLRGRDVTFADPLDARLKGLAVVYQELGLAANLDVVANIFLGRELTKPILGIPFLRMLDDRRMGALAEGEIDRLAVRIPHLKGVPVESMSGGQRQSVAIARAAYWTTDVLFMDEPTAALGVRESRAVLDLVRNVLARGVAVVMISHVLPHVMELADHTIVMRQGRKVADLDRGSAGMDDLIRLIVGA